MRASVLLLLCIAAAAFSLLERVDGQPAPFVCCRYNSQNMPGLMAQSCALIGDPGCAQGVMGWDFEYFWKATYGCAACEKFDDIPKSERIYPSPSEVRSKPKRQDAPLDINPCCLYSDPNTGYTSPIETVCLNPDYKSECDGTYDGLTLLGQWSVDELYNQCFFLTVQNGSRTRV